MSLQTIIHEAESLTFDERNQFIKAVLDMLNAPQKSKLSLRDLCGQATQLADGTAAQEQIKQIRAEWDVEA